MNSISIKTYIQGIGSEFLEIEEAVQGHRTLKPHAHNDYVAGAVIIEIYGVMVTTFEMWDDVNWMWPAIVDGLSDCIHHGLGEARFPDQPITLNMKRVAKPDGIYVNTSSNSPGPPLPKGAFAPRVEFVKAVQGAGETFFKNIIKFSSQDYSLEAAKLMEITP